jgi:hypothetical protein
MKSCSTGGDNDQSGVGVGTRQDKRVESGNASAGVASLVSRATCFVLIILFLPTSSPPRSFGPPFEAFTRTLRRVLARDDASDDEDANRVRWTTAGARRDVVPTTADERTSEEARVVPNMGDKRERGGGLRAQSGGVSGDQPSGASAVGQLVFLVEVTRNIDSGSCTVRRYTCSGRQGWANQEHNLKHNQEHNLKELENRVDR